MPRFSDKSKTNFQSINLALVFLLIVAPISASAKPDEVELSAVQSCQYLQNVEGSSGYGKNFNWQIFAKSSALNKAKKLGASHVVWERFHPVGAFNGIAVAKAYSCNS